MGTEADGVGQHGPAPHGGGHVAAEPVAQHGQAERAGLGFGQHAERRQQAQHPVQRRLIGPGGPGQRRRGARARCQQVRDIEFGGEVDGTRDVQSPDHAQQRGGCGAFVLGRLGRARRRVRPNGSAGRLRAGSAHGCSFPGMMAVSLFWALDVRPDAGRSRRR